MGWTEFLVCDTLVPALIVGLLVALVNWWDKRNPKL